MGNPEIPYPVRMALGQFVAEMPEALAYFDRPCRYKAAWGGRASAKSWTIARKLLIRGIEGSVRVLCTREIQKSIKKSVHQLLSDQIQLMDLGSCYEILETEIRSKINDTIFSFEGLSTSTIDSLKSYEGYDIVWVEEAQMVSERSWKILTPTIRKSGSEIWITMNPVLETDASYVRFVANPPPNYVGRLVNWRDNPWFNQEMNDERLHCKRNDPDYYPNIWEGQCLPAVEGAIYFRQVQEMERQNRIRNVPYDPLLKVHVVMDIGGDALTAALVQVQASEIRIIEYIEVDHTTIDTFSAILKTRPYNWGRMWVPHDGFAKKLEAKFISTADSMTKLSWDVVPRHEMAEASVEEGIKATAMAFSRMYFDKEKCAAPVPVRPVGAYKYSDLSWRVIECLKRYKRHINPQTEVAGTPVHDPYCHGADTIRYVALNADRMTNESQMIDIYDVQASYPPTDREVGL